MIRISFTFLALTSMVAGDLVIKPTDVVAVTGEAVTFNCSSTGTVEEWWVRNTTSTFTLFEKHIILSNMLTRYDVTIVSPNSAGHHEVDLVLTELDFTYAGKYICYDERATEKYSHSAELTVVNVHPLREFSIAASTFLLVAELEYAGNVPPRMACFDVANNESINASESTSIFRGAVRTVRWISDESIKTAEDRTIKCYFKFCSNATDCHPRTFERVLNVSGSNYSARRNQTFTAEEEQLVQEETDRKTDKTDRTERNVIYLAIALVGIFALIACVTFILYVRLRLSRVASPPSRIYRKERVSMIRV